MTKLLNDLSFWAEVERYKDLADIVKCTKKGRAHTPEDDIMVHKKAHAIINCFVDSAVMPRVQVVLYMNKIIEPQLPQLQAAINTHRPRCYE